MMRMGGCDVDNDQDDDGYGVCVLRLVFRVSRVACRVSDFALRLSRVADDV